MKLPFSTLSFLAIVSSHAWGADRYQYVIEATNDISRLNSQSSTPSAEALASAGNLACKALTQLLKDAEFRKDLDRMKDAGPKTQEQRASMKRELRLFVDSFMRPEEEAFRKAGLNDESVRQLLWSANMFHMSLDDKYDSNRILTSLDSFRKEVCATGTTFEGAANAAARRVTIQRWSFRLGGVSIIVADLAAALPSAAVTVGSVAIGTAVMSWP